MKERLRNYTLLWILCMTRSRLSSRARCLFGVSILRIDRRRSATSKLLLPILRYRFTAVCRKTATRPASSLPSAGCLWKCLPSGGLWQRPFHAEIGAHKSVLAGGYLLDAPHMANPSAFVKDQGRQNAFDSRVGRERSARRSD